MKLLVSTVIFFFLCFASFAEERRFQVEVISDNVVRAIGPMDQGFATAVINATKESNSAKLIIMSPGGQMDEAHLLNAFLSGKDVIIEGYCISACAYGILSARSIEFGNSAILAFHDQYIQSWPTTLSLIEYSKLVAKDTLRMQSLLERSGIPSKTFYKTIIDITDVDRFIVIRNYDQLKDFKQGKLKIFELSDSSTITSYLP